MCSTGSLRRLGAHGLPSPVTVTTSSALSCCLRKRWTLCLDPALARATLRPREQRSRELLPPRHVPPGCSQASPLCSPYPVLCPCACSVVVTSLAVSHLRVEFWGNPSHKAGARGAVLVSIHGRLEGRPAGQICFLHRALTPALCSGHHWGPIRAQGSDTCPSKPWRGREQGPCLPHTGPCQPGAAARIADAGCACGRACRGTSAPATEWGGFYFPPWPSPLPWASGRWWHVALLRCQPGCWR